LALFGNREVIHTRSSATPEIARDANETVIQGHSRSFVVVPIDARILLPISTE